MVPAEKQEQLDDIGKSQQWSIWEQHPQVCASDISGGSIRGAKSIISGHVEDVEHASVQKGGKRYMKWPKPEYSGREDVPLSHMAESHLDMVPAEKQEQLDDMGKSQQRSIWEQHPEVCASDISGGSDRGAKSIIIGHVEDVEPASVHKGGKTYMKWLKPQNSGREDVPLSHMTASHLNLLSAEEQEWVDGIENCQQWSGSEQHPEVCASCISDMKTLSSHKRGKRNFILDKTENMRKEDAPLSHLGESHLDISTEEVEERLHGTGFSQQQHDFEQHAEVCAFCGHAKDIGPYTSHKRAKRNLMVVKRGDTGKGDASVASTESLLDMSSKEEKEILDSTGFSRQQSDSEQYTEVSASCLSGQFHPSAKKKINEHIQDHCALQHSASWHGYMYQCLSIKQINRTIEIKDAFPKRAKWKKEAWTLKSVTQDSHASCKHMKPTIMIKDSLPYKSKLKKETRTLKPDSVIQLRHLNADSSFHITKLKNIHCSQCSLHAEKMAKLETELCELKKGYSEAKIVISKAAQESVDLKEELQNLRWALEKEKRRNNYLLFEQNKDQLKEKEKEYNKEVKKKLEISVTKSDAELSTTRNKFNQVSPSDMTENKLWPEYDRMKYSSMMRLEREKIKYQNQKKKCLDITEILREKSNDFQRIHRLNEEALTKTSFQHNEQFDIPKVENVKQNFTLESEKKNAERMETEVKLYPDTLAAAPHHCVESQTPKRQLELAFQRARHGDFSSQEKKNFDAYSSDIPSQQNSKSEIKNSDLENEIGQKKDTLGVRTLISEQEKSLLKQTKCQMKECKCQNEQSKMSEYTSEQKSSIKEILSKLQSKMTLLQRLLHDLHKKEEKQNNVVINIQNQFHDIRKRFQAQMERHNLLLQTRNMKLFNENNHLKEKCQHKNKNRKRKFESLPTEDSAFRFTKKIKNRSTRGSIT